MHQQMLGADELESSFAEKAVGSWWTPKLNMSQQHALFTKDNSVVGCIRHSLPAGGGR